MRPDPSVGPHSKNRRISLTYVSAFNHRSMESPTPLRIQYQRQNDGENANKETDVADSGEINGVPLVADPKRKYAAHYK